MEEHLLLFRRDLADPDDYEDGYLSLPILAEDNRILSFLVRAEAWSEVPSTDPRIRVFRVWGALPTGERVLCRLSYDDSDYTQMLRVRSMIDGFRGEYRFLSNFWPAIVQFEGREYPSVEHAYQAAKATDEEVRAEIATLETPGAAKRAGSALRLGPEWTFERRLWVMRELLHAKFAIQSLRERLLGTGDAELIEVNDWGDRFWGVCDYTGENRLGEMLMEVRAAISPPP